MKLFLLTAAFFGVVCASPVSHIAIGSDIFEEESPDHVESAIADEFSPIAPAAHDVVQTRTISNTATISGQLTQYIVHLNGINRNERKIFIADQNSANGIISPSSNVFRDVMQISSLSNRGVVSGDVKQYVIHINGLTQNKRRYYNTNNEISVNGISSPFLDVFGDVTQTSTMTNSGTVAGKLKQYIININGLIRNKRAFNIASERSTNCIVPFSVKDPVNMDNSSDPAIISKTTSPISSIFGRVRQVSNMENTGVVVRESTRCIIHINGVTQNRKAIDSADDNSMDVTDPISAESVVVDKNKPIQVDPVNIDENSPISNAPEIVDDNGPILVAVNDKTSNPTFSVFRDVTQRSTLSNSGTITRGLIQYIVHINGLTTKEIRRFTDQMAIDGFVPISDEPAIVDKYKPIEVESVKVDENSPISNEPAVVDDNAPISVAINDKTNNPSSVNVYRDVTQKSTLSNSGTVTRDLTQYIVHMNGVITNELWRFSDEISVNGMVSISVSDGDDVQTGTNSTIFNQIREIVDQLTENVIENDEKP